MGNFLKMTPFTLALNVTSAIFYTRLVLEMDEEVAMFGNKAKIFVACPHLSLDRKEVLNQKLMLMLSKIIKSPPPIQLLTFLHIVTIHEYKKLFYCCIIWLSMQ